MMTNVTFLIGNGFDLNCGLRTRFTDMYPSYLEKESTNAFIRKFKEDIKKDEKMHFQSWSDFEMGMASYLQQLNSEEEFLSCLEDFSAHMNDYLLQEQESFSKIVQGQISVYVTERFEKTLNSFYHGLPQNGKIKEIENRLSVDPANYSFIIYNYTNSFDYLLDIYLHTHDTVNMRQKFKNPIHIHGSLAIGTALGIDNEGQIGNLKFKLSQSAKRAFIKPFYNSIFDAAIPKEALNMIIESHIICIFGKQLGQSDLTWNKAVFEWLLADSTHELIFWDHHCSTFKSNVSFVKMNKEDETKRKILIDLGGNLERNSDILSQIHIPIGINAFNIRDGIIEGQELLESNKKRAVGSLK